MRTQIFRRLEIAVTFIINGCAKPQEDFYEDKVLVAAYGD